MTDIKFPILVIADEPESPIQIGVPVLEWEGAPLTFPTMGPWRVEMSNEGITELTITIPVRIEVRSKS